MKLLLALVLAAVAIYLVSRTDTSPSVRPATESAMASQPGRVEVVSFACAPNPAYYSADIAVRNIGESSIEGAFAFVEFTPEGGAPFVEEVAAGRHLAPGAMGSNTLISRDSDGRGYGCRLLRIQGRGGASLL